MIEIRSTDVEACRMSTSLSPLGALAFFSGLCFVALLLVFLLVEETKRRSLEDLDRIFEVHKSKFVRFQVQQQLPWFVQRHVLRRKEAVKPSLYMDLIWGKGQTDNSNGPMMTAPGQQVQMVGMKERPGASGEAVRDSGNYSPTQRPASLASNDSAHA